LPGEDSEVRDSIDEFLLGHEDIPSVDQTALTIVPYQRWIRMAKPDLNVITDWYLGQYLPRLKARSVANRHGTYFERLVSYTGVKNDDGKPTIRLVNQLEHLVNIWSRAGKAGKRPRQSALQLSCFDPAKDHTGAALAGFPCLQQVSLTYKEAGTLELTAYYPTQYMLERAYGNYLGLCQLGHLIAHLLGVRLTGFNCFVANPELGNLKKSELATLANQLRARLQKLSDTTNATIKK